MLRSTMCFEMLIKMSISSLTEVITLRLTLTPF
ncbi:hypothetical protein LINPERPRIM_LOCUS36558 [Linum perenne]